MAVENRINRDLAGRTLHSRGRPCRQVSFRPHKNLAVETEKLSDAHEIAQQAEGPAQ